MHKPVVRYTGPKMGRFLPAHRVAALLLAVLVSLPAPGFAAKRYTADRFDVAIRMMPDGALRISETVVFRFEGGPFTFVFRDLSASRTDGISVERITIDGSDVTRHSADIAHDRGHVRVTWRFRPLSDAGLPQSAVWKGFRLNLQEIAKGRTLKSGASARDVFEPYFPYATAFGLAQAWTRHFRKEAPDLEMPAWFHAARFDDGGAAFAAMVSSSGGASSGAAAGGGASGAG